MIREELRRQVMDAAKNAGAGQATTELVLAHAAECAYVSAPIKRLARDGKPGASRMGGLPDLPEHVEWPTATGETAKRRSHADFLAQFNLSEVPDLEGLALPRAGFMWVFVRDWHGDELAVIYDPASESLKRRAVPAKAAKGGGGRNMPATPIRFKRGVSLPVHRRSFQRALDAAKE